MNRYKTLAEEPEELDYKDLGSFLESVEKQAYVIALASCKDRQTALDIVQDAMFNMVKSYQAKPAAQWRQLFFTVLNNRITDTHRKRGFARLTRWFGNSSDTESVAEAPEAVDQLAAIEADPAALADSLDLNEEISQALNQLSVQQRQTLIYRLWLGLSVKETANAMNISEGSVKTHLSRAVAEMRKQLEEFYH